ncbi:MAG: peptidoglycan DD-metalloendopeptidase family protein [Candidatus Paceibacterota bacterium]
MVHRVPFFVVFVLLFTIPAVHAHAGIFSFVNNFLKKNVEESVSSKGNVQNLALLQAALNVDPNPAKGGGEITVVGDSALLPDTGPLGTIADMEESAPSSDKISIYIVRDGDSLSQIAKMFGVSTNTIIWANDISRGDLIREGQTLVILPLSGIKHTVEKGDTLNGIVKKYKGDIQEILDFNDLTEDVTLAVGDEIIIPDGELGTVRHTEIQSKNIVRGTSGPSYVGYYINPVPGSRRSQGIHGYNGIDLAAPYGTQILASAGGTVILSRSYGWNGGYGNYVVIRHPNGTQTLYAHNSRNIVSVGASVVQGQVIGYVGSTGRSTGSHVHFEVRGAKNPF